MIFSSLKLYLMEFNNTKFYHKFLEPGKSEFIVRDSCALISQMEQTVNRCASYMVVH